MSPVPKPKLGQAKAEEAAMRLLCIDPGLACTGCAVVDENGKLQHHNSVTTVPTEPLGQRLSGIGNFIYSLCLDQAVAAARVELPPARLSRPGRFARVMNADAIQGLTLATGAIIYAVSRVVPSQQIELVPPVGSMRIGGRKVRSDVKKKIARAVVLQRYGLKVNEHVAEAILLAVPATTAEIANGWLAISQKEDR